VVSRGILQTGEHNLAKFLQKTLAPSYEESFRNFVEGLSMAQEGSN